MNIPFLQIGGIFLTAILTWSILGAYFVFAANLQRVPFVVLHYLTSFLSSLFFFYLYNRFFGTLNPFTTMIIAMISFFIIELIFFSFVYKEELWFLNFVDWIVPVFIIASTIYFVVLLS